MDSDLIFGVLMILFWVASGLIARFGKAMRSRESGGASPVAPAPSAAPARGATFQKALRQLAEQMGLEIEVAPAEAPVASEHTLTGGEHRRTMLETRPTASEARATASEHRRTASEARRTVSEAGFTPSEHQMTENEHLRGDLRRARLAPGGVAVVHRRLGSQLARRVVADLADPGSLARAIVLREILGPPVALRPPE